MSAMAYDKIDEKEENECHLDYLILFSNFKIWLKFDQLFKKAETKTLRVDDGKFEDNFRFYPTGQQYKEQMRKLQYIQSGKKYRKKYVGSLNPQANIDLQYIVNTIKATDDGFNSNWYVFDF